MSTNPVVIQATDLGVDFWVDGEWVMAAEGLNYTVRAGEVLAIVGESGSGKSASSMSLLGLLPANGRAHGSVLLGGMETIGAPPEKLRAIRGRDIAVIFQEPMTAMNPVYTIGFQIVEALKVHFPTMSKDASRPVRLRAMSGNSRDFAEVFSNQAAIRVSRTIPASMSPASRNRCINSFPSCTILGALDASHESNPVCSSELTTLTDRTESVAVASPMARPSRSVSTINPIRSALLSSSHRESSSSPM